jgi:hypothetical protein
LRSNKQLKSSPVGVLGKEISQALDKHCAAVGDPVKVANSLCAHLVTYIAQHSGGDYPKAGKYARKILNRFLRDCNYAVLLDSETEEVVSITAVNQEEIVGSSAVN